MLTSKHPTMTKQLLAYQIMIIREARRCGGNGWLQYDSFFRQQVAGKVNADWSELNTSLYAVTFLAQSSKGGQSCTSCMESDHWQQDCAITYQHPRSPGPEKRPGRQQLEPYSADCGKRHISGTCCFNWNQGECRYPQCRYRHACLHCAGDHPMVRCRSLLRGRDGRQGRELRQQQDGKGIH